MSESTPEQSPKIPAVEKGTPTILERINAVFESMGSSMKYLKTPEDFPQYSCLKGKRIVAVDDMLPVLENMMADLVLASGGDTSAIVFTGGTAEDLADSITALQPDILILDFHLSDTVKGTEVLDILRAKGFHGAIIGASSESGRNRDFLAAGAVGTIDKTGWGDNAPALALAKIFQDRN